MAKFVALRLLRVFNVRFWVELVVLVVPLVPLVPLGVVVLAFDGCKATPKLPGN
jgi:hypothetical protein